MTAPDRTVDAGEDDRCLVHARVAVRQAVMKGMDRDALADAFMMEAIKLTFGVEDAEAARLAQRWKEDRKSTRLNSSHTVISYAVFCLKKKKKNRHHQHHQKTKQQSTAALKASHRQT